MDVRPIRLIVTLLLISGMLFSAAPVPTQATPSPAPDAEPPDVAFAPGELLVRFAAGAVRNTTQLTLEKYAMSTIRTLYNSDVQLMRVPEGQELEVAAALNTDPGVIYAEPNYISHAFDLVPNDPSYSKQWAHPKISRRAHGGSPRAAATS